MIYIFLLKNNVFSKMLKILKKKFEFKNLNYIKIVKMTYFTKNIFENILSYCDDTLEVKQKKLMDKTLALISLQPNDFLSTYIFKDFLDNNDFGCLTFDDYIKLDKTNICCLIENMDFTVCPNDDDMDKAIELCHYISYF